ncbi:MAG: hypothetical protein H8E21_01110 [Gammaproteobacteria bacterium]|nr:hypothetical protein [Gammaproteobacteria bacterium]
MKNRLKVTLLLSGLFFVTFLGKVSAHDAVAMEELKQQLQLLQAQVNALQNLANVVKIDGPIVTLQSNNEIIIQANTIKLKANNILDMSASVTNIKGNGVTNISGGSVNLDSSLIRLNKGNKPVVRVGSKTVGNQITQTVIDGSPTILVP